MSENVKSNDVLTKAQEAVNEQVEKNKPAELSVKPCEFPVHTQGYITNTLEVTKLVSSLFSVFRDYAGCAVYSYIGQSAQTINPELLKTVIYGSFYVDLYFKKNDSSTAIGLENLIPASGGDSGNVLNRIKAVCGTGMRNVYNLNADTKHILLKYLSGYQPVGNFNPMWDRRIVEVPDVQSIPTYNMVGGNPNNVPVILKVSMLSLDAIMGTIYGRYTSEEEEESDKTGRNPRYDYHCVPLTTSVAGVNPMTYSNMQNMSAEDRANSQQYVIQILRNDRSIIEATQKAIGYTPITQVNGYIPYIRP